MTHVGSALFMSSLLNELSSWDGTAREREDVRARVENRTGRGYQEKVIMLFFLKSSHFPILPLRDTDFHLISLNLLSL